MENTGYFIKLLNFAETIGKLKSANMWSETCMQVFVEDKTGNLLELSITRRTGSENIDV